MGFTRVTKEEGLARVTKLVEQYRLLASEISKSGSEFTETDARVSYIDPLLEALGWDVRNRAGLSQRLVEVVMERAGSGSSESWGRPDYRLRIAGIDTLPVEAKKPSITIATNADAAFQARSYGWSLSLPASILTNFDEFLVFDTRVEPNSNDHADVAVIPGGHFQFDEYVTRFDDLWRLASYESLSSVGLEGIYDFERPPRGESPFDVRFLKEFRSWRQVLAQAIADGNPTLGAPEIGRRTQRVLNALLFLRVCEDRNIGDYQDLLRSADAQEIVASFRRADKVFNAGLFTVLDDTEVDSTALGSVVREMYWPNTQFAFGVLDPQILAGVYEQYLAEVVVLDGEGNVSLELKPEVSHSGGVVVTPDYIVDEINSATLDPLLVEGVSQNLSVLDMAVGSGIFLLDGFERLVETIEAQTDTHLSLAERGEVVRKHLFGIDIDSAAVEVAKLSLLLAVLGNEFVDVTRDELVLPELGQNIICGNSIVREDFDITHSVIASDPERRARVAPTDLSTALGTVSGNADFSAIIGNPPYVRIQELTQHMTDQLAYLQDPRSKYESPASNNFDMYMVFIERALMLLKADGRLGMIVPHRFTNHLSASGVRLKLAQRVERIVHFGEEQVFPGRTTYVAIVVAGPKTGSPLEVEMVQALDQWRNQRAFTPVSVPRDLLTANGWPFATEDQTIVFEQLKRGGIARLGDPEWVHIFVGIQTSADDWYFIKPINQDDDTVEFVDVSGELTSIERAILRPALKDQTIEFYDGQPEADRFVIFPYVVDESSRFKTIRSEEMQEKYPLAFRYFMRHSDYLKKERKVSPDPGAEFWAYGRSQSLNQLAGSKLIVRVLSLTPRYALDTSDLVVPGGGDGGPYYLLRPRNDCPYSIDVVQAILSHRVVDLFVAVHGKKYRGSYASHRKAFLQEIPVPKLSKAQQTFIEDRVPELRSLAVRLRHETDSQLIRSMSDRRDLLAREVEDCLSIAYGLDPITVARVLETE